MGMMLTIQYLGVKIINTPFLIDYMKIKKISAKSVKDSRGERTIQVIVKTSKGKFVTSAPAGKSTGRFEVKPYAHSLKGDIQFINKIDAERINELGIDSFEDLKWIERFLMKKVGANSLFALEACILKGLAREEGKELFEFLGGKKLKIRPVGNAIGGGLHSKGIKGMKPDFQEFLFIAKGKNFKESVRINETAYWIAKRFLRYRRRNDEGAWETIETNKGVLEIMRKVREIMKEKGFKVDIGVDVAASKFYNGKYNYKNSGIERNKKEQIDFLVKLIERHDLFYVEDGFEENDFSGFKELMKKVRGKCLIVGDDLIATNPSRLKKAIKMKAINAIIVKPNQIGSLLKVKEVVDIAKKKGIKTIISHRSGETMDNTIADLGVGFGVDFIKTGIYGSVRRAKLKRVMRIEKRMMS